MTDKKEILLQSGTNELELIEFMIAYDYEGQTEKQYFGINVAKVREIIRMPEITLLPNLPNGILGVFNLRNKIIPALDLKAYLYQQEADISGKKMIIAEFNKLNCGFIVDDVSSIHRVQWDTIESPESLCEIANDASTIVGIIKLDKKNILMLDVEKIVADVDPNIALDSSKETSQTKGTPIAITAEDSMVIRNMITSRLKKAGFRIESYNDGAEAWAALKAISKKVGEGQPLDTLANVVITDIEMPKMDGYTLTKSIKDDEQLAGLPVVIFSSIVSDDVIHKGKSVGADAQLTKPQIGDLIDTVNSLL